MLTVIEAQDALNRAWEMHQKALDSGSPVKIVAASKIIQAAVKLLKQAQNHEAMNNDIKNR